jgi:hypothetical protein
MTDAEYCTLVTVPLRQLTGDQLSDYAAKVFLTLGDVGDFRYFLPRLLDISLHGDFLWPDPEVLLGKLFMASWRDWPTTERAVLEALFTAIYDDLVAVALSTQNASELDTWLCAMANAGMSLAPFLTQLERPQMAPLVLALYEQNALPLTRGEMSNSFWKKVSEEKRKIVAWLQSDVVQEMILQQYG